MKRVLAYLEQPGPAPKVERPVKTHQFLAAKPPLCSKPSAAKPQRINHSISLQAKAASEAPHNRTTHKKESITGAVPKVQSFKPRPSSDSDSKPQFSVSNPSKQESIVSISTASNLGNIAKMADTDSVSKLRAFLASMGVEEDPKAIAQIKESINSTVSTTVAVDPMNDKEEKPQQNTILVNEVKEKVAENALGEKESQMSREEVMAQRAAKKEAKQAKKSGNKPGNNRIMLINRFPSVFRHDTRTVSTAEK